MIVKKTMRVAAMVWIASTALCAASFAGPHPRLFIKADDIPRLRHACGLTVDAAATVGFGNAGRRSDDFQALRLRLAQELGDFALPGEVAAAAFLHLVDPDDPADAAHLALINAALQKPPLVGPDILELALALDWCWADVTPSVRREFVLLVQDSVALFDASDSPLDHRSFRAKLATLAVAIAVDETDDPAPSWARTRNRIINAARAYFATSFRTFVRWRGLIPTGPQHAAAEESDTVLAIELAGALTGTSQWDAYRDSVGRWLEHYVLATLPHPALQHQFLRDDGTYAPLTPAARWDALLPMTAHLLAARTHDPAAALIADRVERSMREVDLPGAILWRWVPIVYELRDVPRADRNRLPAARNLEGAVILRGGSGPQAGAVWIDTGPPFLRRGQHFDAGHFLIYAGGHLAVDAGEDVSLEAVPAKGGVQRLGREKQPFDINQYYASTIAHNCMIFWDPARVPRWYGKRFLPIGGQRPLEQTCRDFVTEIDAQQRRPAALLAYGNRDDAAYAAIDLSAAYDARSVRRYTREFVFLWGRALLTIDRVQAANSRVIPTWIVNVPSAPTVEGATLGEELQFRGSESDAGVWRVDQARWLRWTDHDGSLLWRGVLPERRAVRVVGGPAARSKIPSGTHQSRTYTGGGPDSFERLILPSGRPDARNAWYALDSPTQLGRHFAQRSHWGRLEVEAADSAEQGVFINLLVSDVATGMQSPTAEVQRGDSKIRLTVRLEGRACLLVLPDGEQTGGELSFGTDGDHWALPATVQPDPPLPVR